MSRPAHQVDAYELAPHARGLPPSHALNLLRSALAGQLFHLRRAPRARDWGSRPRAVARVRAGLLEAFRLESLLLPPGRLP